ncbi:hypothetical protein NQ317_010745 [Molorchus minor]|uniref:Uncharacterized protein n=1 Tax=Molorchus minor TaxID=1323400 RepID=A0ABQ9JEF8_9CUCU|nr:hypothetical protein NQ317_010745 [Molorchus minor]
MTAKNTTYNEIFFVSPLYAYWPYFNEDLKIFAVRTLQLWQYGGISFDLKPALKAHNPKNNTSKDVDSILNKKLLNFIITEKNNYEKLPTGVVTADDEALHMESKIPCHAFSLRLRYAFMFLKSNLGLSTNYQYNNIV